MSTTNRAEPLMPYSTMPRDKQYMLAWGLLEGHAQYPEVSPEERAHAKCWLSYRCCDLAVSYGDYRVKIESVPVESPDRRWYASLAAVRIFCHAIHAHGGNLWQRLAAELLANREAVLQAHPPAIQNLLRVGALVSYRSLLDGSRDDAVATADELVSQWTEVVGRLNWREHPFRFAEMHGDLVALECLMSICRRANANMVRRECDELTGANLAQNHKEEPWMRALMRMNRASNQVF